MANMRFVVITFLVPILALLASVRAAPSLGVRELCGNPNIGPMHLDFYPELTGHMHYGKEYEFDFDVYACYGTDFGPWTVQFYLTEVIVTEFNGAEVMVTKVNGTQFIVTEVSGTDSEVILTEVQETGFNVEGARFIKHYMTTMDVHTDKTAHGSGGFSYTPYLSSGVYLMEYTYVSNEQTYDRTPVVYTIDA